MDNITVMDPIPTEDVLEIGQHATEIPKTVNPYHRNSTDPSLLDSYNSTQTNWTFNGPVRNMLPLTGLLVYIAVRCISGGLAIFGNSLTLFAVYKFERLQTCTNYLICSLAVSDILAGLMVPLVLVHELYPNSWFFIPVCLSQQTLALISGGGNLQSILFLSIDRYIYIAFALRYHGLVTAQRIVIILTITWLYSFLAVPITVFNANHLQVGMPCRYHSFLDEWTMIYVLPQLFIIFIMTIGFNLAIAKIAYQQARQIQVQQQVYNTLDVATNQSTKKISRTLVLVLGVYLFSMIPQVIMSGITSRNMHLEFIERYTVALYWVSSCVNPVIYAWRFKDFGIAFKKIFTGTGSFNEAPWLNA